MNLELKRPIAFFDLETTGINTATDRIVEIAILKIMPDGSQHKKRMLLNPEMHITKTASDIHGITDEMVKDAPTFKQVANEILQFMDNCDIGGYNSNKFDVPVLIEEFLRVNINFNMEGRKLIDVQKIFHKMEQRTLTAAYKFYCDKELEDAHTAMNDTIATFEVLDAQLERYNNLGKSVDNIIAFIGEEKFIDIARRFVYQNGVPAFNFGKHKGKPVEKVFQEEPQYYDWMMRGDFPLHTKQKLSELFNEYSLKKLNKK